MPTQDKPEHAITTYYPPTHDVLVHFAESIGSQRGEGFDDFEVVHGLADFMHVIARTLANSAFRKLCMSGGSSANGIPSAPLSGCHQAAGGYMAGKHDSPMAQAGRAGSVG